MAFARAVQASNGIEGYDASLDDVVAAVDDEPTLTADEETRLALSSAACGRKRIQAERAPKETGDPFELASAQLSLALS
jgi:hypothetical protein